MSRPACVSVCSAKPAKTSMSRRWNGFSSSGMSVPGGQSCRPRRELGVGRDPAQLLLPREDALAMASQPSSNLPLYLSAHSLKTWCGPWTAPRRPVHEERLVGLRTPAAGAARRWRCPRGPRSGGSPSGRRADRRGRVHEPGRLLLRRLARQEAVEILEADARRPVSKGPRGGLLRRRVVPLAEGRGGVAVVLRAPRRPSRQSWGSRRSSRPSRWRSSAIWPADAVMVSPGQQRRARRRAHRRRSGSGCTRHRVCDAVERRRVDLAAVSARRRRADVIDQDDRMLGAFGRQTLGARHDSCRVESCMSGPRVLADGVGGNGRIEPSSTAFGDARRQNGPAAPAARGELAAPNRSALPHANTHAGPDTCSSGSM